MLTRIEVAQKSPETDAKGRRVRASIREDLHLPVDEVRTLSVYTLDMEVSEVEVHRIAHELFCDPVTEKVSVGAPLASDFDFLIEVGYRPGVTDNVARSAQEGIHDLLGRDVGSGAALATSRQYLLRGGLNEAEARLVASKLLANELIESYTLFSRSDWEEGRRPAADAKRVTLDHSPVAVAVPLPESSEALVQLSDKKILALSLEEMRAIQAHYADPEVRSTRLKAGLPPEPMDVELEVIAQTWSEHCKHKIFAADIDYEDETGAHRHIRSVFKTYIRRATNEIAAEVDWLRSVFTDNAGVIRFNEDWDVCIKVETHNSPSALDPYGGAMTGIVGVNRDVLGTGKGCRPIFNTDVFCFASPFWDKPVPEKLLHPKRLFKGVHLGVRDGGNESGIPTVNGSIVFDDRFLGKPLVFCGTGGLIPRELQGEPSWKKRIEPGDRIVMAGGRIGKDGIHGATFSSAALTEASPTSAVQIGDPITQKKLTDFLLEARDRGLYRFLTDNGAGGLSSSLGEMATECGGCRIHLDRAPLKYPGLDPWEILVSEAQERMSFAVPPEQLEAFLTLAANRGVEASELGEFTSGPFFEAYYDDKPVCRLDMHFLHDGNPTLRLKAKLAKKTHSEPSTAELEQRDLGSDTLQLLGALNICSKESWVRQYDHEVQAGSVVKPFTGLKSDGPSDAAVIRPVYRSKEGLVVAHGLVPRYSDINAYHMAANAIDEAVRNAVAVGASPGRIAGLDNFCWPDPVEGPDNPDGAHKLAQLVEANEALYDYCRAYSLPCISGKDSMKNDYGRGKQRISIPPTLLFTVIAPVDDVEKCITMDAKSAGDCVYLLGDTHEELGGSEYFHMLGHIGNRVPKVDAKKNRRLYATIAQAIERGLLRSAHDCSDGGLAVALAETCMAGRIGMDLDLDSASSEKLPPYALLFSESAGRFVVTVSPEFAEAFETLFAGQACRLLGKVADTGRLRCRISDRKLDLGVEEMFETWHRPLNW